MSTIGDLLRPGTVLSNELGQGAQVKPSLTSNMDLYGCGECADAEEDLYAGVSIPGTQNTSGVVIPSTGVEGYTPGVVMPTTTQLYGVDKKFVIGGIGAVVLIAASIGIFVIIKNKKSSKEGLLPEPGL